MTTSPSSSTPFSEAHHRSAFWGTVLGLVSAVGYTAANIFLRAASDCDPLLVSSVKALPTVLYTAPWLLLAYYRGRDVFPSVSVVLMLATSGLFAHFAGNVMFQWSLGVIGIALTVPLCLGTIICASAVLGRVVLLEPVTPRVIVALATLVVAIAFLSRGAAAAVASLALEPAEPLLISAGVAAACTSGFAYSLLGMTIRKAVTRGASVTATTFTVAIVGLVCLSAVTSAKLGWEGVATVTNRQWLFMLLGGMCNVAAFLSLARALQLTTLVYVNALNASQVAMASVAGILLFGEPTSAGLAAGVGLTIVGLLFMPRHPASRTSKTAPARADDMSTANNRTVATQSALLPRSAGRSPANCASNSSSRESSQEAKTSSEAESSITPT